MSVTSVTAATLHDSPNSTQIDCEGKELEKNGLWLYGKLFLCGTINMHIIMDARATSI